MNSGLAIQAQIIRTHVEAARRAYGRLLTAGDEPAAFANLMIKLGEETATCAERLASIELKLESIAEALGIDADKIKPKLHVISGGS